MKDRELSPPDPFERQLLDAARADRIPDELKQRMSGALSAAPAVTAAHGGGGWSLLGSKPAAWTLVSLVALAGVSGWQRLGSTSHVTRHGAQPVTDGPSAIQATAGGFAATTSSGTAKLATQAAVSGKACETCTTSALAAAAPAKASELREEIALLDRARAAIQRRAPEPALGQLDLYARRFAHGTLLPEAAALRIEALVLHGDSGQAAEQAERFLRAYPQSPLRDRVDRLVAPSRAQHASGQRGAEITSRRQQD